MQSNTDNFTAVENFWIFPSNTNIYMVSRNYFFLIIQILTKLYVTNNNPYALSTEIVEYADSQRGQLWAVSGNL